MFTVQHLSLCIVYGVPYGTDRKRATEFLPYVFVGDGREVGSQNVALLHLGQLGHAVNHLEADVLSLLVTIQPEHQKVGSFSF